MEESNQAGATQRTYEERQRYNGLAGSMPTGQSVASAGSVYDDEFVEAVVQRLAQRLIEAQKLQAKGRAPSPGQRLALAIVSLAALFITLIPIFGITSTTRESWIALPITLIVSIACLSFSSI